MPRYTLEDPEYIESQRAKFDNAPVEEIGVHVNDFGEMEGGDEVVREPLEEPDGIGEQHGPSVREDPAPGPRVEGREGHVRSELVRARQAIQ